MLSIHEQMRNSVELFYYSQKFNKHLFVLNLQSPEDLRQISDDLKVIHSSHIRSLICCPHSTSAQQIFQTWISTGSSFQYRKLPLELGAVEANRQEIEDAFNSSVDPVLAFDDNGREGSRDKIEQLSLQAASLFGATKVFFLGSDPGLVVDGQLQSHPSHEEIDRILSTDREINIGRQRLKFLRERQRFLNLEIILLEAVPGGLFQEIFTHGGRGTLLSSDYPNVFRQATALDVPDITFLIKPYIDQKKILPLDEEQILAEIEKFYVYTVNFAIVALAKFTDYGDCYELGKICTLPRYQRKGRARTLVENMIQLAKEEGKSYIFSLSIEPMMWRFYLNLGFTKVTREELPQKWQEGYDFSRPSRAFRRDL